MEEPIVTFIYASQTGNGEEISLDLFTTAQEKGYTAERYEFDDHLEKFDLTSYTPKRIVVLFASSTGDGEPPDNGIKFYKYLNKHAKIAKESGSDKDKIFSHLKYTILGLGDSNYSSFHKCPKTVDSWFAQLGAEQFWYFGKADEALDLEMTIKPWTKHFWKSLPQVISKIKEETLEMVRKSTSMVRTENKILAEVAKEEAEEKPTFKARISNKTIEADKYRKVMRLEIELDREVKAEETVQPGSYVLIYPQNDLEIVEEFISLWHWVKSDMLINKLSKELDFLSVISQRALRLLVPNPDDYTKETSEFNYFDIIKHLKPETEVDQALIEYIPKMKARYYSLASDLEDTNKFEICFTVEVHEKADVFTEGNTLTKKGVCSHYLNRLAEEEKVEFDIKLNKISQFATTKQELEEKVPIIFISHGTAIAPFISVLQHFKKLLDNTEIGTLGDIDIYYGIRNQNYDFLYQKELTDLLQYFKDLNPDGKYNLHLCESRPGNQINLFLCEEFW